MLVIIRLIKIKEVHNELLNVIFLAKQVMTELLVIFVQFAVRYTLCTNILHSMDRVDPLYKNDGIIY